MPSGHQILEESQEERDHEVANVQPVYIGICGQGPSDFPEFATFLVELGIDSMSLIPDTAIKTRLAVAAKEKEMGVSPE